jgi:prolyl-tRNA editing enzyme YbaK/EbsC (Cys-tRNA(Pro) deacylase)
VSDPDRLLHGPTREQLDAHGVEYEVLPCDPALADTAAFVAAYGVPPDRSANTIVVAGKGPDRPSVACILLATTALDVNATVRRELGVRKASFAGADPVRELTGMEIGGVTPFGLPESLPILVDPRVMAVPWVILGGGNRSSKLKLGPGALERLPGVRVCRGARHSPLSRLLHWDHARMPELRGGKSRSFQRVRVLWHRPRRGVGDDRGAQDAQRRLLRSEGLDRAR